MIADTRLATRLHLEWKEIVWWTGSLLETIYSEVICSRRDEEINYS